MLFNTTNRSQESTENKPRHKIVVDAASQALIIDEARIDCPFWDFEVVPDCGQMRVRMTFYADDFEFIGSK